jgi:hypothetical protein
MKSRHYGLIVTVAVLASLLGGICGAVLTYIFTDRPILAQETSKHETVIRAEGFVLVDKNDKTRAMLISSPNGNPSLIFYNKDGKPRIGLSVSPDGQSSVVVADKNGKVIWSVP